MYLPSSGAERQDTVKFGRRSFGISSGSRFPRNRSHWDKPQCLESSEAFCDRRETFDFIGESDSTRLDGIPYFFFFNFLGFSSALAGAHHGGLRFSSTGATMRIACRRRALGKGHCSRPSLRRQRQRRKLSCSPSDRPRVQTAELMLSAGLAYLLLQFRITSVGPELTKRQAATKFWLFRISNPTSGKRDILRRSASHIPIGTRTHRRENIHQCGGTMGR